MFIRWITDSITKYAKGSASTAADTIICGFTRNIGPGISVWHNASATLENVAFKKIELLPKASGLVIQAASITTYPGAGLLMKVSFKPLWRVLHQVQPTQHAWHSSLPTSASSSSGTVSVRTLLEANQHQWTSAGSPMWHVWFWLRTQREALVMFCAEGGHSVGV